MSKLIEKIAKIIHANDRVPDKGGEVSGGKKKRLCKFYPASNLQPDAALSERERDEYRLQAKRVLAYLESPQANEGQITVQIGSGSIEAVRLEKLVRAGLYQTFQEAALAAYNALYQDHVAQEMARMAAQAEIDPDGKTDLAKLQGLSAKS